MIANILPADPLMPLTWLIGQKSTFSEHGHVAYQITGNHEYSNMVANILRTNPPSPQDPRARGQKIKIQLFQNMIMLHIKLKGIMNAATWFTNILLPRVNLGVGEMGFMFCDL